nr:hypothetical protein [Propionibacterium sp.]
MTLQPAQPLGPTPDAAAPAGVPVGVGAAAPTASWAVEYPVFFVPELAQARLAAAKRNRTWRLVSLALSAVILAAIWWFLRDQLGPVTWPVIVISLAFPLGYLAWAIVQVARARRAVRTVAGGLALGVGRGGVVVPQGFLAWPEVVAVRAASGRWGRGDELRIEGPGGLVAALPLEFLSAKPATIDGALKALSGGRCRVDFSRLDA